MTPFTIRVRRKTLSGVEHFSARITLGKTLVKRTAELESLQSVQAECADWVNLHGKKGLVEWRYL